VQCGLLLQLNLKNKFKSATATDLFSHRTLPAEKAWYVYHSSIITDMGPGFIAFADKKTAENFIKGFEGELLDYPSALKRVRQGFK
jgi:nitrous oxide reductase accessory protein NosL